MKKIGVLVLALTCVLGMGGCSGKPGEEPPNAEPDVVVEKISGTTTAERTIESPAESPAADTVEEAPVESLVREDCCALYLQVLEDLWEVDPGLNSGISLLGIDLSGLTHLSEAERERVAETFAAKHELPFVEGTWEELCDQGYIDREQLFWEDGLFFCIKTNEDASWNLPALKEGDTIPEVTAFDAHKWRSGLGAYFFGNCAAQKEPDGTWSYDVGQEAIS